MIEMLVNEVYLGAVRQAEQQYRGKLNPLAAWLTTIRPLPMLDVTIQTAVRPRPLGNKRSVYQVMMKSVFWQYYFIYQFPVGDKPYSITDVEAVGILSMMEEDLITLKLSLPSGL